MTLERIRANWITRRRYLAYLAVVAMGGGAVVGYLLGDEHTVPALAAGGLLALALVLPPVVATRPIFDERDWRLGGRAATYTMYVVTASSIVFLAGPIVLEQLGIVALQGWMLFVGLVLIAEVYLYVAIEIVLRYRS